MARVRAGTGPESYWSPVDGDDPVDDDGEVGADDVRLSAEQLNRIEAAVRVGAVARDRYGPAQLAGLDGESRSAPGR